MLCIIMGPITRYKILKSTTFTEYIIVQATISTLCLEKFGKIPLAFEKSSLLCSNQFHSKFVSFFFY